MKTAIKNAAIGLGAIGATLAVALPAAAATTNTNIDTTGYVKLDAAQYLKVPFFDVDATEGTCQSGSRGKIVFDTSQASFFGCAGVGEGAYQWVQLDNVVL
jgi:hypothetical protein